MKAYEITVDDLEYRPPIVWAETSGKAKSLALGCDELLGYEYLDLRVKRIKWADDLEKIDEWEFTKERVKHEDVWLTDTELSALTTDDLDLMDQYKSEFEMWRAWENGDFKTSTQIELEKDGY